MSFKVCNVDTLNVQSINNELDDLIVTSEFNTIFTSEEAIELLPAGNLKLNPNGITSGLNGAVLTSDASGNASWIGGALSNTNLKAAIDKLTARVMELEIKAGITPPTNADTFEDEYEDVQIEPKVNNLLKVQPTKETKVKETKEEKSVIQSNFNKSKNVQNPFNLSKKL
jgi:hypothetical protein